MEEEIVISTWQRPDLPNDADDSFSGTIKRSSSKENIDMNAWLSQNTKSGEVESEDDHEEMALDDESLSWLIEGDMKSDKEHESLNRSRKPKPKPRHEARFANPENQPGDDKGSKLFTEIKDKAHDLFAGGKDKADKLFSGEKDKADKLFAGGKDSADKLFSRGKAKEKGNDIITSPRPVPLPRSKQKEDNPKNKSKGLNFKDETTDLNKISANKLFDSVEKSSKSVSFGGVQERKKSSKDLKTDEKISRNERTLPKKAPRSPRNKLNNKGEKTLEERDLELRKPSESKKCPQPQPRHHDRESLESDSYGPKFGSHFERDGNELFERSDDIFTQHQREFNGDVPLRGDDDTVFGGRMKDGRALMRSDRSQTQERAPWGDEASSKQGRRTLGPDEDSSSWRREADRQDDHSHREERRILGRDDGSPRQEKRSLRRDDGSPRQERRSLGRDNGSPRQERRSLGRDNGSPRQERRSLGRDNGSPRQERRSLRRDNGSPRQERRSLGRDDGFPGQERGSLGGDDGFPGQERSLGKDDGSPRQERRSLGRDDGSLRQERSLRGDDGFPRQERRTPRQNDRSSRQGRHPKQESREYENGFSQNGEGYSRDNHSYERHHGRNGDETDMFEDHVPAKDDIVIGVTDEDRADQHGRRPHGNDVKSKTPMKAQRGLEAMVKSPDMYNFKYESRDSPLNDTFARSKGRSSSMTDLNGWKNNEFEGYREEESLDSSRSGFNSSRGIRDAVYAEWLERKREKLKEAVRKKVEEKKKEEEKLKEKQEKEIMAKKAFEAWSSKKEEVIKTEVKKKKEIRGKDLEEKREKIIKKQDAKKFFESWKSKKDEVLKESYKDKRNKEREDKQKKIEDHMEKIDIAKKAYDKWKSRKDEQLKEEARSSRQAEKLKTKYEKEAAMDKLREREKTFEEFLRKKGTSKRPPPSPSLTQRAWCPGGLTKGTNLIPEKVQPVIAPPKLNRSRSFSGVTRAMTSFNATKRSSRGW